MKLHDNFYIKLGEHIETRWRTIKKEYGGKDLEEYEDKKFYPIAIYTKNNNLVCYTNEINEFLELLGAFISNQLNTQKTYGFNYKNNTGGFYGKIIKKQNFIYLGIKIANIENYILEKYDCRVVIANAKQILNKCSIKEFLI